MSTSRLGLDGVAVGDTTYAIGGKLENGKATGVNEIFHPATVKHQRSK
jgi:hypothetical protein